MRNIITKMERAERLLASCIFCVMMFSVASQIIMRYIFNRPLLWSEELARYTYVWLVFIGAAYDVTQEKHIAVTLVTEKLPKTVQNSIKVFFNLLIVGALAYMLPHAIQYMFRQNSLFSGCMQIPMSWVYAALPAGYVLIIIHLLLQTFLLVKNNLAEEETK